MPLRGPGGGGGGGGLIFRRPANIFTGANLGACRTARDAYFVAPATAGALSYYQGNEFLSIVLNPANSTVNVFETYLPGNAGSAYARAQWVARSSAIQGNPGPKGDAGTAVDATARSAAGSAAVAAAGASSVADANAVDIATEAVTRADADSALGLRIDAVPAVSPGSGADPTARRSIAAETTNRKTADTALGARIDAEATHRSDADLAEASVRTAAVASLGTRVADEAAARIAGDALAMAGFHTFSPGPTPFRFIGLDRKAAVAAREKYFSGEVALSQAYVDIFSSKTASFIRVTLDVSVTEQVGATGNAWALVLGTDHTNTAVTITPNTPGKTFTLRLPDAGITLDALAADLDGNSRLNAQVAGNGSALVDHAATWGPNPAVGAVTPFRHGGDQSTIERTAWLAEYIADQNLVLVLAYGILEEYQHWEIAGAPAVSGWATILTLVDPPAPNYMPGPTPTIFSGADRAAAEATLDKYLDSVSGVTQAQIRILADASNYITVSLNATVAKGPKGNKWALRWGGDSSSAGAVELETVDSLFRATLKWDVNATTLAGLHAEFSGDSKFSSVVTGDDSSVASVAETFGADAVGNTIFFQEGSRTHIDTPHTWFAHYVDDPAATITLEYESRQEVQVWDVPLGDFRTAFTLLDSPARSDPFTVLTHPSDIPTEDWQWTLGVELGEEQLIGRAGGTVMAPTTKDIRPLVPVDSTEVHFRFIDHTSTYRDQVYIAALILPSGNKVAGMNASFALGPDLFHLRISDVGAVYLKRATAGTTTVLCDIWYR